MEKLELKYLASYLPYELKMVNYNKSYFSKLLSLSIDNDIDIIPIDETWDYENHRSYNLYYKGELQFFPILRPLSNLSKEIEHNGEKFIPLVELLKIKHNGWYKKHNGTRYGEISVDENKSWFEFQANLSVTVRFYGGNSLFYFPEYWIMEKLFNWHFDVFELIPKGLAVDINTLNK